MRAAVGSAVGIVMPHSDRPVRECLVECLASTRKPGSRFRRRQLICRAGACQVAHRGHGPNTRTTGSVLRLDVHGWRRVSAGRVSPARSQVRHSGGELQGRPRSTGVRVRVRCARCRGCSRRRCGRRRRNLSGWCSGWTSGSSGPGRPRPARRPGRGSRCRTGSQRGPGTRPSSGWRTGPARRRRGLRRRRYLR